MKQIPNHPNYMLTVDGRVWSTDNDRWLVGSKTSNGSIMVKLNGCTCQVHRLMLETFVGPCPKGAEARHHNRIKDDNNLGNLYWATLTYDEETAIRQCHHDFSGKSIPRTAKFMGRSVKVVQRLLRNAEKKAPQMFPILNPQHQAILMMYDQNMSRESIAAGLDITLATLEKRVVFLREHGFLWDRKPDQYCPSMDGSIKERF